MKVWMYISALNVDCLRACVCVRSCARRFYMRIKTCVLCVCASIALIHPLLALSSLQLQSLQSQLEFQEQSMVEKSLVSRQEAKIREIETKLEFEKTQVKRLEVRTRLQWASR